MENSPKLESAGALVQHGGKDYRIIREGRAYILKPPAETAATQANRRDLKPDDESQTVFYNPIQQFNRDLTVLAIRVFGENVIAADKEKDERRKRKASGGTGERNKKRKRKEEGDQNGEEQDSKPNVEAKGTKEEGRQTTEPRPQADASPSPSFTILDALSASGLRALRYASEIPFVTRVVANDLSSSAIQSMKVNIEYNGLEKLIQPNNGDARIYMYNHLKPANSHKNDTSGKFNVIDLDPYGTASPFLDAAVQGIKDEGLICITCTDASVWASNGYPEKAFSLYGGVPLKGVHSHEAGLRLILNGLATSAGKYGLAIEPLLSLSIDFYARLFVRVHRSPAEAKFTSGNTMMVYNCDSGCGAWTTQPLTQTKQKLDKKGNPFYFYGFAQGPSASPMCEHCGWKTHLAGPMWGGPLHNPHFVQKILDLLPEVDKDVYQTKNRIEGMLTTALEEDLSLEVSPGDGDSQSPIVPESGEDAAIQVGEPSPIIPRTDSVLCEPYPFYFSLSSISKVLHTTTVPYEAFRGALRHLGYKCTRSHAKPNTVRTNAHWAVTWEIMREWVRQKAPIKEGALKPGTAGAAIIAKSRENNNPQLATLKKDLISAAETGKDLSDIITKVESALYRSGSRQVLPSKDTTDSHSNAAAEPQQEKSKSDSKEISPRTRRDSSTVNLYSELEVVFDEALGRENRPRKRLVRYQVNPRANWGPLSRAGGS
ncbi:S-adenosyl-L-methionine-dependent methyltransferase [Aspergillus cavernicola]|uniref:tRNA (guanine(26)-N(2))-dimethyltransferase n=1 Tax=Aspergillus cavernicola TaxID=176166 RepID=A0ABR4J0U7_9EURO